MVVPVTVGVPMGVTKLLETASVLNEKVGGAFELVTPTYAKEVNVIR